jgi:hypothetical protein
MCDYPAASEGDGDPNQELGFGEEEGHFRLHLPDDATNRIRDLVESNKRWLSGDGPPVLEADINAETKFVVHLIGSTGECKVAAAASGSEEA